MKVTPNAEGVTIDLDNEAAAALTALLGRVIDETTCVSAEELFERLASAGFDEVATDPIAGYKVEVEMNLLYDPFDEEDSEFYIRLRDAKD